MPFGGIYVLKSFFSFFGGTAYPCMNRGKIWRGGVDLLCHAKLHPHKRSVSPLQTKKLQVAHRRTHTHTHTHPFNGPFSRTTRVSRYQKGKNQSGFYWSKRQWVAVASAGHMQVCTSLQTDNHVSTSPLGFFTSRMPFLLRNQQRQSTEGKKGQKNCQQSNLYYRAIYQRLRFVQWCR